MQTFSRRARRSSGGFHLFESLLAGAIDADPAMLRILAGNERFGARYDASKQELAGIEVIFEM